MVWDGLNGLEAKVLFKKQTIVWLWVSDIYFFSAKSNYFTNRLLKIETVEFSPGYGFRGDCGKAPFRCQARKLRGSQRPALHFANSSVACGTLCMLGLLICKQFSCHKKGSGTGSKEACCGTEAKVMFPACELATLHWQMWIRWLSAVQSQSVRKQSCLWCAAWCGWSHPVQQTGV